jgi:surface polysaccharide O-acyltransferase-like enzyme
MTSGIKRRVIVTCITVSFLILGSYAIRAVATGHDTSLWLLIAPTISIFSGYFYLHRSGQRSGQ